MRVTKSSVYVSNTGWRCVALSAATRARNVHIKWQSGPLKGREACVPVTTLHDGEVQTSMPTPQSDTPKPKRRRQSTPTVEESGQTTMF